MPTIFPNSPATTFDAAALLPDRGIASLWRRVLAFLVDGLIIGIAANVVALPFFEPLSRLGSWGPFVGFFLALPYFAVLNSSIANGQTLGKRLLHIQVVDIHGNTVPFSKSLLRYAIFAAPFYLDKLPLSVTRTPPLLSDFVSEVFGIAATATIYLVRFQSPYPPGTARLGVRNLCSRRG